MLTLGPARFPALYQQSLSDPHFPLKDILSIPQRNQGLGKYMGHLDIHFQPFMQPWPAGLAKDHFH